MSSPEFYFSLLCSVFVFLFVAIFTPAFSGFLKKKGITGRDVNKKSRPKVAEMGGAIVVFAFLMACTAYCLLFSRSFLPVPITILLVSVLGAIDHFMHFRPFTKLLMPLAISLIALPMVSQSLHTPFGILQLGGLAYILFMLSFPIVSNMTNMVAGFNGLEAGLGAVMAFALAVISLGRSEFFSFFTCLVLFAGLFAFRRHNRYPASVFPGDVLTMSIGAILTIAAFSSGLELYLLILLLPYFIDALLKFRSAGVMSREGREPLEVSGGILRVPKGGYMSFLRLFVSKGRLTEQELVAKVINIEMTLAVVTIVLGLI